jgi:LuxR family transcriptional regulator, maltose regulon positive regulatory protein
VVAGDWQPHVPAATVGRPDTAGAVVGRPEVIRPLLGARDGILVVVAAPAGYGKTTAVGPWDEADERPFAWLRIDHLDNDPTHLLLHIATAVAGVHPVDRKVLRYLRGPGRSSRTAHLR